MSNGTTQSDMSDKHRCQRDMYVTTQDTNGSPDLLHLFAIIYLFLDSQYQSSGSECSLIISFAVTVDIVDWQDIHFPLVTDDQ